MRTTAVTVLNATLTSATSYSSGALDVSDLAELAIDGTVSAKTYTSGNLKLNVSRIGADGNLYLLDAINLDVNAGTPFSRDIGAGLFMDDTGLNQAAWSRTFGDKIQIDLVADAGNNVTTTISIIGK